MYSILIVEDHDRLREQLATFYEQEGYHVAVAASGEEAREKLSKEQFALVLSDVKMPGVDGFQLTRHIREKYPQTDVILITAFGNVKDAVVADERMGKVSIVGTGIQSAPGFAARMFRVLSEAGINIEIISTSEIRITCIIPEDSVSDAVRALHKGFELEKAEAL